MEQLLGAGHFKNIVVFGFVTYSEIKFTGIPKHASVAVPDKLIDNIHVLLIRSETTLSDGELEIIYQDLLKVFKAKEQGEIEHTKSIKGH